MYHWKWSRGTAITADVRSIAFDALRVPGAQHRRVALGQQDGVLVERRQEILDEIDRHAVVALVDACRIERRLVRPRRGVPLRRTRAVISRTRGVRAIEGARRRPNPPKDLIRAGSDEDCEGNRSEGCQTSQRCRPGAHQAAGWRTSGSPDLRPESKARAQARRRGRWQATSQMPATANRQPAMPNASTR